MPHSTETRAGSRPAGVSEVARLAGVSLGTVSNVLNRPHRVSVPTRERVRSAMLDLGFVPNEVARQLREGRSRALAYVMLDASNPFFAEIARGIEDTAESAGLSVFLCNSDSRANREQNHLDRLGRQRVKGVLLSPMDPAHPGSTRVTDLGTPVVIVGHGRTSDKHCSVAVDDAEGGGLAVTHLLEQGHGRIAFVGGPNTLGQVRDRYLGAQEAFSRAGLSTEELVIVPTKALTVADGRQAGERLAEMSPFLRPTAAFCANDLVALGLLQQCVSTGIRVPHDLAIVGYDDIQYAAAAAVPLTSVRQPCRQLGETATRLLLDETSNPDHGHRQVTFPAQLVVRASSHTSSGAITRPSS